MAIAPMTAPSIDHSQISQPVPRYMSTVKADAGRDADGADQPSAPRVGQLTADDDADPARVCW